jgi:two-component system sensor histidine kinase MprB
MSLRWKLALSMGFLLLTMVALVSVSAYLTTNSRLREEVDTSLDERANSLRLLLNRGEFKLPQTAGTAQLLDSNGDVVQTVGEVRLPVDLREYYLAKEGGRLYTHTVTVDGKRYRVETASLQGGGVVQVARELEPTEQTLSSLRRRYAAISGLVALLGAIIGWLLAGWLTRPVVRLTAAAEHVATTGDLDAPVEESGHDETSRLAHAFSSMLTALRESRARQRMLVQDAGHELRTPVTAIRTNVDVLRRYPNLDADERAKVLEDVHGEVAQVSTMVDELVLLASGDADEDDTMGAVHLDELVRAAADRAGRRFSRGVTVDVSPLVVGGSARGLERAINNLLSNAGKFSPPGTPLEVTLRDGRISVRDHGPGIAEEDLPHVFQRFYRATTARTQPGSGLGLAIVDQVARAHGGEAFAENHPDGGAVVGFTVRTGRLVEREQPE